MQEINGSWGEGGGQILRTSLSLAAITGQELCLTQIRAGRKKPGLAAQHLTSVWAAAAICKAQVKGDQLGSMTLDFIPTCPPQSGFYTFDVSDARMGGSAGAVSLILQTILPPLALAVGESVVILKGGTHVPFSPPITYIEQVYLPTLEQLGLQAQVQLQAWGWYPQGGGRVELRIQGNSQLKGLNLLERGELKQVQGLAVVTELPSHIPQRMASRAESLLRQQELKHQIQPLRAKGIAQGAGIFLVSEYESIRAGFSALGKRGLASETVADLAVEPLLKFHQSLGVVDSFLADQVMLPLALAHQESKYRVFEITEHLKTNAWTISQFGLADIDIDNHSQVVSVTPKF